MRASAMLLRSTTGRCSSALLPGQWFGIPSPAAAAACTAVPSTDREQGGAQKWWAAAGQQHIRAAWLAAAGARTQAAAAPAQALPPPDMRSGTGPLPPHWQDRQQQRQQQPWLGRRLFHTSTPSLELGIVQHLSLKGISASSASKLMTHMHKVEVVEFSIDGAVTEREVVLESLKLHPRDMLLYLNGYYTPQRAVIAIRDGMILFRTECTRAIITATRTYLFPACRKRDTVEIAQSIYSNIASIATSSAPFEVKVLEALLAETTRYFDVKSRRLEVLAASVTATVSRSLDSRTPSTVGELERLLPVQSKLTELKEDVKETLEAVHWLLVNEESLASACLSDRKTNSRMWRFKEGEDHFTVPMQKLAAILERYEYQMRAVHGSLQELEERLDGAKIVWQMQLDTLRNRIIHTNLAISMFSLAIMVSTVPACFFGMNLVSGWEDVPGKFHSVVVASIMAAGTVFGCLFGYFMFWPHRQYKRYARDIQSLQDLLSVHIDDLDDVLLALKRGEGTVSKRDFARLVSAKRTAMTPPEVDLLWRVFDTNREAFLKLADLVRSESRRVVLPLDAPQPPDDVQ